MNFFNIGPMELILILVLALIVFGPKKLPEIAKGLGKAISDFQKASQGLTEDLNRELSASTPPAEKEGTEPPPQELAQPPAPELAQPQASEPGVAPPPEASAAPAAETDATKPTPESDLSNGQ
jgi:sec-independent protein translocase protein TatA